MSRKAKITMIAALVLLGAVVISILPGESKDALRVSYVGLSPTYSHCAVFAISNTTRKSLILMSDVHVLTNRPVDAKTLWETQPSSFGQFPGTLPSRRMTTCTVPVVSSARWSSVVAYYEPRSTNSITTTRHRLAIWAFEQKWYRVSGWLYPGTKLKIAYGPEMFGDKPMATVPK